MRIPLVVLAVLLLPITAAAKARLIRSTSMAS